MPDKVLIYSRFPKALMVRIGAALRTDGCRGQAAGEVFTADQLAGVRAMITAGGTPLAAAIDGHDAEACAPIVCYGTGYDGVDLAAAASADIAVGHSPGANAASVADLAVTLMLAATRRLLPADDYVRSGNWAAAKPSPLMRPQPGNPGRRVGVYGMGEIGRKIASRARGVRDRGRLFQPQPARRALSIFPEPGGAGGMVQRADDRGSRRRRYPSRRQCRDPAKARQGRLCRQYLARLGDRPGGAGRRADRQDHRRRRSRRVTRRSRTRRTR